MVLEPPPTHKRFETRGKALKYAQNHTKREGYALTSLGFKALKKDPQNITKVRLCCDRGCKSEGSKAKKRETVSKLTGCQMKCNIVFYTSMNAWKIITQPDHEEHNHPLSDTPSAHSIHRQKELNQGLLTRIVVESKAGIQA